MSLKNIFAIVATAFVASHAVAQDKLASLAPIDRHIRAIDSVSITKILKHENLTNPAFDLYQSWNNTYTKNYAVEIPKEYKIDLRGFHMPCESKMVTSHYGYRRSFRRNHYGTDIKVYTGDTIYAAFSGKIRIAAFERKGYGNYVIIRHANGLETVYGHMSKHLVKENEIVKAGQPIGLGGDTGRSFGSHLHFETRFLGQFIDPEKLFDFSQKDVLADFYLFRSNGRGKLLASNTNIVGGEEDLTDEAAALEEKAEESRNYQEQRRQNIRNSVHKVRSGESLYSIAKKYHTTVAQLTKINNLSTKSKLRVGQIIRYN